MGNNRNFVVFPAVYVCMNVSVNYNKELQKKKEEAVYVWGASTLFASPSES